MKILAIDSCTRVASCAVSDDERIIASGYIDRSNTHSVKLLPLIEGCLNNADLAPRDIDIFAATIGPGSYTGQRIGLSTAQGMADAHGKLCAGVSSLLAMAHNVPYYDGIVAPIIDARNERVYNGLYRFVDGQLETLTPDRVITLEELLTELSGQKALFLGDGIFPYADRLATFDIAPPHLSQINAAAVARIAQTLTPCKPSELLPIYLQKGDYIRDNRGQ